MGTSTSHRTANRLSQYTAVLADDTDTSAEGNDTGNVPASATWEGVLGVEGKMTGDGRLIEPDALRWETPFPIRIVRSDVGGHDGAEVAGTCTHLERRDGGILWGSGPLDMGGEAGREAYRVLESEVMNGISMDLDDVSFEVRVAQEVMDQMLGGPALDEDDGDSVPAEEVDDEGRVTVVKMDPDSEVMVTTDGRVRAATIVAIPAFIDAKIGLSSTSSEATTPAADEDEEAVTASATPLSTKRPPREWFQDPGLDGPTPFTVTHEGRVYGHLATWGTCHVSHAMEGECLEPPSSHSNYAYFRAHSILTAEGDEVAVGRITTNTVHADTKPGKFALTPAAVMQHYDNTGNQTAYVASGEDAHGIWVAGCVKPGATKAQIDVLRSSPLSGDWRMVGGHLELLAVLAVNSPGFPIPRPSGLVASGRLVALTASSGMVAPRSETGGLPDLSALALSKADIDWLKTLANRERNQHAATLADRVKRSKAALAQRKVRAFAARRK